MAYSQSERSSRRRYGDDIIDEGQELIDQHNEKVDDMHVSDEELRECMDQLDELDDLPDYKERMAKSLNDLRDDVMLGRMSSSQLHRRIDAIQDSIAEVYATEKGNRRSITTLAKSFTKLCEGLATIAERATPPSRHAGVAALAKALLPANTPMAEQIRAAQILKSWYGEKGGQAVQYTPELCAKLRLSKSITSEQESRWRKSNRLPDWVNVDDPSRNAKVEWQSDSAKMVGNWLSQVSPLYLASLRLR